MNQAIQNRVSRRNFTKEPLSNSDIKMIQTWISKSNEESNLTIQFLEDGSEAFHSLAKSYGIFSNVRSMLLMKGSKEDENIKEKVGYYGEELVLNMVNLGLGTCWVGGTYDNSKFIVPNNEQLVCVIVVGNVQKSLKDQMIRTLGTTKNRKDISKRIITNCEVPQWVTNGLEAIRLAPSALNSQKPMIYYENETITMKVAEDYLFDMVDLGIAKKHFEIGANKGKFELGNGAKFILNK